MKGRVEGCLRDLIRVKMRESFAEIVMVPPTAAIMQDLFLPQVEWNLQALVELTLVALVWWLHGFGSPGKGRPSRPENLGGWVRQEQGRLLLVLGLWMGFLGAKGFGDLRLPVVQAGAILSLVWLATDTMRMLLQPGFWARTALLAGYAASVFFLLSWFDDTLNLIASVKLEVGNLSISLYGVLKGLLVLLISLWIALGVARFLEARIKQSEILSPTMQVLLIKISKIALLSATVLVSIQSMGINLTTLAVFGGALGVGIGFGLQPVVSNFISGFVLLTDRSVKPGDVIEIGGTYGWINTLGARYVSVVTRDGKEHLIPNETLITQTVINWSFSDQNVRLKIPVGISYKADPHQAIQLVLQAARDCPRVLENPAPSCLLIGFGESSLDLEARVWIRDPFNGMRNVQSEVLLRIWDLFKSHGIEIPYPQRDVHLIPPHGPPT